MCVAVRKMNDDNDDDNDDVYSNRFKVDVSFSSS